MHFVHERICFHGEKTDAVEIRLMFSEYLNWHLVEATTELLPPVLSFDGFCVVR